jgi:hypothetical protein
VEPHRYDQVRDVLVLGPLLFECGRGWCGRESRLDPLDIRKWWKSLLKRHEERFSRNFIRINPLMVTYRNMTLIDLGSRFADFG